MLRGGLQYQRGEQRPDVQLWPAASCPGSICSQALAYTHAPDNYGWAVRVTTGSGTSDWSAGLEYWVVDVPPAAPIAQSPSGVAPTSPIYTWTDTLTATDYRVTVRSSSSVAVLQQSFPSATHCSAGLCSATLSPPAGGDYTWTVRGENPHGAGPESNVLGFSVSTSMVAVGQCHSFLAAADRTAWGLERRRSARGLERHGEREPPLRDRLRVTQVATGFEHTLALDGSGSVVAWGSNSYGQPIVERPMIMGTRA